MYGSPEEQGVDWDCNLPLQIVDIIRRVNRRFYVIIGLSIFQNIQTASRSPYVCNQHYHWSQFADGIQTLLLTILVGVDWLVVHRVLCGYQSRCRVNSFSHFVPESALKTDIREEEDTNIRSEVSLVKMKFRIT